MRLSKWLFPCLTVLAVAASVLLPERLSRLADRGLFSTVHAEELPAELEDGSRTLLRLEARIRLLAGYRSGKGALSSYSQKLQPGSRLLEEHQELLMQELHALAEDGIIPESLIPEGFVIQGDRLFVRDTATGEEADFLLLTCSSGKQGLKIGLDIDGAEDLPLQLTVSTPVLAKYPGLQKAGAEALGRWFLGRLGVGYKPLTADKHMADFYLTDDLCYLSLLDATEFSIQAYIDGSLGEQAGAAAGESEVLVSYTGGSVK